MAKKRTPKIKIEPESLTSQAHAAFGGHLSSQFSQQYNEFSAAQEKFNQEMDRALFVFAKQPLVTAYAAWVHKMRALDQKIVYCDELFRI